MGKLQGGFQQNPCPGKGDAVSWFAWSCLFRFLRGVNLKFSQELWRRWQIHRTLSSGLSESPVLTLGMESSVLHDPRHPAFSPCSGTRTGSSVSWGFSEYSGVVSFGIIFSSPFGAVKRLKSPTFSLNAAEFYKTWVCSFSFPFLHSVFLFGEAWDWFADLLSPFLRSWTGKVTELPVGVKYSLFSILALSTTGQA